jgi:hypothetical protein
MAENKTKRPEYTADFIKTDADKAVMTGNPHIDNLMTTVVALGAELWASRRREAILEKMLEEKGVINRAKMEAYVPSKADAEAEDKERDAFIKRIYKDFARNI